MVGKKAGKEAAAQAAYEGEAKKLQAEWDAREKVDVAILTRTRRSVTGMLIVEMEKVLPHVATIWKRIDARMRQEEDGGALARGFRDFPEPFLYYVFASFGALLMSGKSIISDMVKMPEDARERFIRVFTVALFGEGLTSEVGLEVLDLAAGVSSEPPGAADSRSEDGPGFATNGIPSPWKTVGCELGFVEYTVRMGPSRGQTRPAVVTKAYVGENATLADLCVFFSPEDAPHENPASLQKTPFSAEGEEGTWRHPALMQPSINSEAPPAPPDDAEAAWAGPQSPPASSSATGEG